MLAKHLTRRRLTECFIAACLIAVTGDYCSLQIRRARVAARLSNCKNNLRQHSGFHGLHCDTCRPLVIEMIRGEDRYPIENSFRIALIENTLTDSVIDEEVKTALSVAAQSEEKEIREAATSILWALNPDT